MQSFRRRSLPERSPVNWRSPCTFWISGNQPAASGFVFQEPQKESLKMGQVNWLKRSVSMTLLTTMLGTSLWLVLQQNHSLF
jgi:hypothetical protein